MVRVDGEGGEENHTSSISVDTCVGRIEDSRCGRGCVVTHLGWIYMLHTIGTIGMVAILGALGDAWATDA